MQKIITFLAFQDRAEEAANFYLSLFKNSRIVSLTRAPKGIPAPEGTVLLVTFELDGQRLMALNGGPHFTFTEGISLCVNCDTQEEIDRLWERLTDGGQEVQCGWLKDKFGVSWQIVPSILGELINRSPEASERVMAAIHTMKKLDIETLRRAADTTSPGIP